MLCQLSYAPTYGHCRYELGLSRAPTSCHFATENHQEVNAKACEDAGAAVLILDSECTGPRLLEELRAMLADAPRLKRMGEAARTLAKPVAVETIVETIFSVSFEEAS